MNLLFLKNYFPDDKVKPSDIEGLSFVAGRRPNKASASTLRT